MSICNRTLEDKLLELFKDFRQLKTCESQIQLRTATKFLNWHKNPYKVDILLKRQPVLQLESGTY